MTMIYLEDFIELIEDLHNSIKEQLSDMHIQDQEILDEFDKLEKETASLLVKKLEHKNSKGSSSGGGSSSSTTAPSFSDFNKIFQNYKELTKKSSSRIESINKMSSMIDRYLKHLENEIKKFAADLDNDNPNNSKKLREKALHELEEQNLKRKIEKDTIKAKEKQRRLEKREDEAKFIKFLKFREKLSAEAAREGRLMGAEETASMHAHDLSAFASNQWPVEDLNKLLYPDKKIKPLSLELLIYTPKLPTKDKKFNNQRPLPSESDIQQAAKIASILSQLTDHMSQSSLAKMITNENYNCWSKESIEQPKILLKAYLKYLATPIPSKGSAKSKEYWWSSFRRDDLKKYTTDLFDDESDIASENAVKLKKYNKMIDDIFREQSQKLSQNSSKKSRSSSSLSKNTKRATNILERSVAETNQKDPKSHPSATQALEINTSVSRTNSNSSNGSSSHPGHIIEWVPSDSDPKNERNYCICNQVAFGNMIKCDNDYCRPEWFHYSCVNISQPPKGNWLCPVCQQKNLDERSPVRNPIARTHRHSPTLIRGSKELKLKESPFVREEATKRNLVKRQKF